MIRIANVELTWAQLFVLFVTAAAMFLEDITGDLLALGVDQSYINIVMKFLTGILGAALLLKIGPFPIVKSALPPD